MKTLYEILEVDRTATPDQIKRAYRLKSKLCHPDAGGDKVEWEELPVAFDTLSDPELKEKYDTTGAYGATKPDNSHQRIISLVAGAMAFAIVNAGDNPTAIDLVEKMKGAIKKNLQALAQEETEQHSIIKRLEKIVARFKVKSGTNVLDDMVRANLRTVQQRLETYDPVRKDMIAALKFMDDYTFDVDNMTFNQQQIMWLPGGQIWIANQS
jgi:DnaJ-class molecular chaperone